MTLGALAVLVVTSALLLLFGLNLVYLSLRALRLPPGGPAPAGQGDEPLVCVQLPLYNEFHVAARVIDAAAALDWPRDRLEIQVLDDSTDATRAAVDLCAARWRRRGVRVRVLRRRARTGFKAGALAHGLAATDAGFVAIFDADFVPPRDFLRRLMGAFADPQVGFVQARWGHLNERFSALTRLQALAIDYHFGVEQAVRAGGGLLTNFAGTAGVWRREAVEGSGGWSARTLTEDFDLSYRAQLAGWRAVYVDGVVVGQELPVLVDAYRRQQARWATGSFQCARLLLGAVLRSGLRPAVKLQAAIHLVGYAVPLLMLLQLACYPVILLARARHEPALVAAGLPLAVNVCSLAPVFAFCTAQARRGKPWWQGLAGAGSQLLGTGLGVTCAEALIRSLRGGGRFSRTPKFRIDGAGGRWQGSAYASAGDWRAAIEIAVGGVGLAVAAAAFRLADPLILVYALLIGGGHLLVGGTTVAQRLRARPLRPPRAAPALAAAGLVAAAMVLGAAFTVAFPIGFEDSYQHWLMAASLAQGGRLSDPLFGMEDTWLPLFHLLGAAILAAGGWHRIELLQAADLALAGTTLAVMAALAPTRRQGVLAVALTALNPVFLLTAGEVVAEPLTAALITGAGLARVRGRSAWAAVLLTLACLTGLKAWLWLLAALAVAGAAAVPAMWRKSGRRVPQPGLAWAVPALLLVLIVEQVFGPGGHSVARAAEEVSSATARGSLAPGPGGRALSFAGYGALACLPTLLLAPLGLLAELRSGGGRHRALAVHAPGLVYLAAVLLLVAAGSYSGSHRYLYLALPTLGLLAAAALDRAPAAAGLLVTAAAAAGLIGYLPVVASFGAGNAGLVAAGRAAAPLPGRLLTDSPVAAYYSARRPDDIVGSRSITGDPVAWLRGRQVGPVVVEDISYYRAQAVLPELFRAGRPPFQPVGQPGDYAAPGGKRVLVYYLPPARPAAAIGPARVGADPAQEPRRGRSSLLAKGVYLLGDVGPGRSLAGEGVGFGVPAVRFPDGWIYPGHSITVDLSTPGQTHWRKTFDLDLGGGDAAHGYRFLAVPQRGQVTVDYVVSGDSLLVAVDPVRLAGALEVEILNEQGGVFDDYADATMPGPAESGPWRAVAGPWARWRSAAAGLEWTVALPAGVPAHAGREVQEGGWDWSGVELAMTPGERLDYAVEVLSAR